VDLSSLIHSFIATQSSTFESVSVVSFLYLSTYILSEEIFIAFLFA
jgi:hypothetical protein